MLKKLGTFFLCIFFVCESKAMEHISENKGRLGYTVYPQFLSNDLEQYMASFYAKRGLHEKVKEIIFGVSNHDSMMSESESFTNIIKPEQSKALIGLATLSNQKKIIVLSPYLQKLIKTTMCQKNPSMLDRTKIMFYLLHIVGKLDCNKFASNAEGEQKLTALANEFAVLNMAMDELQYLKKDIDQVPFRFLKSNLPQLVDNEIVRRNKSNCLFL